VKVKKASYDQEVETARANAELAFKLQVYTANEGPVRIQYKCLVLIYVFPEIKLRGLVISITEINALSPNFHIHVSVINECRNFEGGHAVSFLGIHKSDFGTGTTVYTLALCSAHALHTALYKVQIQI
jgi:hypothetical protein